MGNDPLNATDAQGLCYPVCTVAGGAVIGGAVGGGYYLLTSPNPTRTGFLASTAEGAIVGATVGSGAGVAAVFGVGAVTHAATQFAVAASDNNLGRYGTDTLQTTTTVVGDALIGGAGAAGGKVLGDLAAPYISSAYASLAGRVFLSTSTDEGAAALFIKGADPTLQTAAASALGVGQNFLQDLGTEQYTAPTGGVSSSGNGSSSSGPGK